MGKPPTLPCTYERDGTVDLGLVMAIVTGATVAGIGLAKYIGVRNSNGNGKGVNLDTIYQRRDVCDARFQSLNGWMKRIDEKLDSLLQGR